MALKASEKQQQEKEYKKERKMKTFNVEMKNK
jgi:hypothetical protein